MPSATRNELLSALPADEYTRLQPHLRSTHLKAGEVLSDGQVHHVYFPTSALVSLLCSTPTGESMDVALTGCDGMVGLPFAGAEPWAPSQAVVQRTGEALRLPLPVVRAEFHRGGSLQVLTLRYTQLLMAQMAQTALCSRRHRLDQQLARWILMSMDRCGSKRLDVTQQQLASMFGVRREGVSLAVARLQSAGVLHWGRGRMHVTDRAGLEALCCECYATLCATSHRLFGVMRRAA
jgi:CRP-like cAMP-binding protein